jgi:hypothetical protein
MEYLSVLCLIQDVMELADTVNLTWDFHEWRNVGYER